SYSVPAAGTPLLRYGAGVWFGSVSGILFLQLDQVLMTPLSSSYQLGLYVVAVALSQTVTILTNPVRSVLFSAESRSPDMARLKSVSRQTAIAAFIGALAIAIATPFVLPILFGVEFASAVPIVFILLAATIAGTSGSIAGMGLSARGRPGARSLSLLAGFLINLLLVLLLVGPYGGIGAAWATFAGSLTISIVNVIQLRFYFHVPVSAFFAPRRSDFEALVGMVRHWVPARRRRRRPKTFEPQATQDG
uniref:lipopolysaccharide biosynthesis protein n=1 Tax=Blautia wexlerae TaxID=418240 RepID=UPI0034A48FAE